MLDAARETGARQVLVATEVGMLHNCAAPPPDVDFQAVNDRASCRYMKMITPAAMLRCLVRVPTRCTSIPTPPRGLAPVSRG